MAEPTGDSGKYLSTGPFSGMNSEDDLFQRGRKRRRTSDIAAAQAVSHNPSGESTTLRGRGRRRSVSGASVQSDSTSKPRKKSMSPPERKYQRKARRLDFGQKKRNQSPSRSRSKDRDNTQRRRRQRTTSRSRSHGVDKKNAEGQKKDMNEYAIDLGTQTASKNENSEIGGRSSADMAHG